MFRESYKYLKIIFSSNIKKLYLQDRYKINFTINFVI